MGVATNNDFYFSSIGKRSGMVNVMKVDGLGIFLKSGVNSPRGGKLRNPFSRRVERKRWRCIALYPYRLSGSP